MQDNWEGRTYGKAWMHNGLVHLLSCANLRLMYAFLAVFIVPLCLLVIPRRRYIYRYFRRRHGMSIPRSVWMTFVNFCMYMQLVVDRFAVFAGKGFRMEIVGNDLYLGLLERKESFLQLCSHIGNSEIAGYSLNPEPKRMTVMVYGGEKPDVMEKRKRAFERMGINMVSVGLGMDYVFEISSAVGHGDIVSSPADRIIGSTKTVGVTLLGKEVYLPMGPFAIAASYNLDIVEVSVMKVRFDTYRIYVTPICYDHDAPRQERIQQMAEGYTAEMERLLREYPAQWYNYYDFWNEG